MALVQEMAAEKMTITAIAFGSGPHVPFLQSVAKAGNGQYYLTEKARDLKKIFTRETLTVAKSVLVEEEFRARPADTSAVTRGLDWAAAPPLLGYVATSPKGLARVPLVSHKDEPVFAQWQYGLGRSIAFTSDAKAHWAAYWLGWRQFPQFWGQAVRWTLRRLASGVLYPRVEPMGDRARIIVDAVTEDGSLLSGLEVRANVNMPDGSRQQLLLEQTAAGSYSATVPAHASGAYVVGLVASGPGGFEARCTLGFAIAYPPDFADTRPNEPLLTSLAEQTGGHTLTEPEQAFVPPDTAPSVPLDIWRVLLWLAAILLPFDVAARRLLIRREDLAQIVAFLGAAAARLRPRRRRAVEEPSTAGHLLTHIRAEREQRHVELPPGIPVIHPKPPSQTPATPDLKTEPEPPREPQAESAQRAAPAESEEEAPEDTVSALLRHKRDRGNPEE